MLWLRVTELRNLWSEIRVSASNLSKRDIELKRLQNQQHNLEQFMNQVGTRTGLEFFRLLALFLSEFESVTEVLISECVTPVKTHLRTLAVWREQKIQPNLTFPIEHTPCAQVIQTGNLHHIANNLGAQFPHYEVGGAIGYLGYPIKNGNEDVIGHIAIFTQQPVHKDFPLIDVFPFISLRASAELQRHHADMARHLNNERWQLILDHAPIGGCLA